MADFFNNCKYNTHLCSLFNVQNLFIYIHSTYIYIISFPNITTSLFFHPLSLIFFSKKNQDQQLIQSLLDGNAPKISPSTSSDPTALKKKIIKKIEGNTMTLTGELCSRGPGYLLHEGDEQLPTCIGIIISHYKDPY